MSSCKQVYTADFFKKIRDNSNSTSSGDISEQKSETDPISEGIQNRGSDETSAEIGASAKNGSFTNEDKLILKLYSEVAQEILKSVELEESKVRNSITKMKEQISYRGLRFEEINFRKVSNLCGYLSWYGTCHTGLVKKAIWTFFRQIKKRTIFKKQLKVVSLGGGPGYDLVGFCSALQETPNDVKEINFKIIDNEAWESVFKSILQRLQRAGDSDFGSLSKLLKMKEVKITRGFIKADLNTDCIFEDGTLSSVIGEADFVMMVKLESFLSNYGDKNLIKTVVDTMKVGSKFIFIGNNLDQQPFDKIPRSLLSIYDAYQKYKISFNVKKFDIPSIQSDEGHISVFQKN